MHACVICSWEEFPWKGIQDDHRFCVRFPSDAWKLLSLQWTWSLHLKKGTEAGDDIGTEVSFAIKVITIDNLQIYAFVIIVCSICSSL